MSRLVGFAKRAWRNLLRGVQRIVGHAVMPRGRFWLRVRLAGPVDDLQAPPFLGRGQTFAYLELLQVLSSAAEDPHVAGVFVQLAGSPLGFAKVGALRRALAAVREAGKPVVAYGRPAARQRRGPHLDAAGG